MYRGETLERLKGRLFFAEAPLSEVQIQADLDDPSWLPRIRQSGSKCYRPKPRGDRETAGLPIDAGYWAARIIVEGQMPSPRLRAASPFEG